MYVASSPGSSHFSVCNVEEEGGAYMAVKLNTANALCIWCDDVIDNVLSAPRPHTDSGECDYSYGEGHSGQEERVVGVGVGKGSC